MSERTLSVTVGSWGGVYFHGALGATGCWRFCFGFVAVTYLRGEWTEAVRALLDSRSFAASRSDGETT